MTFFSHRSCFPDFSLSFFQIFHIFTVSNVVHDSFFTRKTRISEINSLITPFLTLFVLLRASHNTTSQNTGETDAWPSPPHPKFWGGPSPLGSRPCLLIILYTVRPSINIFDSYQLWYSP